MEYNRLNLFKRFMNSINGFNGYRQLLYESAGKAVLFVFLIGLLFGSISMIGTIGEINKGVSLFAENFEKQVPDFELKNGVLTVQGKMPVIINGSGMTILIDTSDNADEKILDNYDNAILIMKTRMIQKSYANTQVTSFDKFQGIVINKESIRYAIPFVKMIIIFFTVFSVFFFIAGKFISALVISLFGLIVNYSAKAGLRYMDIYRISLYSMTLPIILGTILSFTGIINIVPILLFYVISCVYTWGAIMSISKSQTPVNE